MVLCYGNPRKLIQIEKVKYFKWLQKEENVTSDYPQKLGQQNREDRRQGNFVLLCTFLFC